MNELKGSINCRIYEKSYTINTLYTQLSRIPHNYFLSFSYIYDTQCCMNYLKYHGAKLLFWNERHGQTKSVKEVTKKKEGLKKES